MTVLALACAVRLCAGAAPTAASPPSADVAAFILGEADRAHLPGVAFAVSTRSGVVLAEGRGEQEHDCPPLGPDTPFQIGSLTKSFTAVLVLELVERGLLDLDAPVSKVLPEFSPRSAAGSATLRQLLNHRSGIGAAAGFGSADRATRVQELRALVAPDHADHPFEYSNANYEVLGLVLERVSGVSFQDLVQRDLLAPLGMTRSGTVTRPRAERDAGLACGHQDWVGFKRTTHEVFAPAIPSAGALSASARDLGAYLAFHLSPGDGGVLSSDQLDLLHRPPAGSTYAMGWSSRALGGHQVLLHNGSTPAFTATMVLAPEPGLGVVVMTNTNAFPLPYVELTTRRIAAGAMLRLLGEPVPATSAWTAMGELPTKWALLAGLIASLVVLVLRQVPLWRRAAQRRGAVVRGGALDVVTLALLVFGVPRLFGIPLGALLEFVPDVGALLLGTVVVTALRLGARVGLGVAARPGTNA